MESYQQLLTVVSKKQSKSIDELAVEMIRKITGDIKKNNYTRKNGDLVYEIYKTRYVLPLEYSFDKNKTKWELFSESKGIKHKKKPMRVFNEETGKWVPRYGASSIKNSEFRAGIIESDKSISELKREKKKRIDKNKKNQMANIKRINE